MIPTKHAICLIIATIPWGWQASAQSQADILAYIETYKSLAIKQEKEHGIPASITLAQGILESGAGKSELSRKANNHFGIKKGSGWSGPLCYAWDDDPQKSPFRCYSSAAESYLDHAMLLKSNSRYEKLFNISVYDYRRWAWGLQDAGYATSTTYAKALIGYIDAYKLYALNGGVKLRPGKMVTITRYLTSEQPVFAPECKSNENEESDEQQSVLKAVQRFVVEINGVRCTIMYPGETLASISQKYDISRKKLMEYNELSSDSTIEEGDIVFLEKKKTKFRGARDFYTVKEGDTLYDISQQFGIRLSSLTKMNGKNIFSTLTVGESLKLK